MDGYNSHLHRLFPPLCAAYSTVKEKRRGIVVYTSTLTLIDSGTLATPGEGSMSVLLSNPA